MVEGIKRGLTVTREDWYSFKLGKHSLLSKRINRITLSAGDKLWRIARIWVIGDRVDATIATEVA